MSGVGCSCVIRDDWSPMLVPSSQLAFDRRPSTLTLHAHCSSGNLYVFSDALSCHLYVLSDAVTWIWILLESSTNTNSKFNLRVFTTSIL